MFCCELVKGAEEKFISRSPHLFPDGCYPYLRLMLLLLAQIVPGRVKSTEEAWKYLPVYIPELNHGEDLAAKIQGDKALLHNQSGRSLGTGEFTFFVPFLMITNHYQEFRADDGLPYTLRIADLRMFSSSGCSAEPIPFHPTEDQVKQDFPLSTMLHEATYKRLHNSFFKKPFSNALFEDHLQQALIFGCEGSRSTMDIVFTTQIFLDIHAIIENKTADAYQAPLVQDAEARLALGLLNVGKLGSSLLQSYNQTEAMRWPEIETFRLACRAADWIYNSLETSMLAMVKYRWVQNDQKLLWAQYFREAKNTARIYPAHSAVHNFKQNPVFSGMNSLKLALQMEDVGIRQANNYFTIALLAHVYNAAKQQGYFEGSWIELDEVIANYMSELFKGDLPSEPHLIWSRFQLALKFFASELNHDSRSHRKVKHNKRDKLDFVWHWEDSDIFKQRETSKNLAEYISGETSAERMLSNVCPVKNSKLAKHKVEPNQVELLRTLREVTTKEEPRIRIPWVELNDRCLKACEHIRKALETRLSCPQEKRYDERNNNLSMVVAILAYGFRPCDCGNCVSSVSGTTNG